MGTLGHVTLLQRMSRKVGNSRSNIADMENLEEDVVVSTVVR